MKSVVYLPVALLVLAAGVIGFTLGKRPVWTEGDVIERAATIFAGDTGQPHTACLAVPGEAQIWVEVLCGSGQDARRYEFDHSGALLAPPEDPQT